MTRSRDNLLVKIPNECILIQPLPCGKIYVIIIINKAMRKYKNRWRKICPKMEAQLKAKNTPAIFSE